MVSLEINPATGAPNGVHTVPFTLEDYPINSAHRNLKIAMSESFHRRPSCEEVAMLTPRLTVGAGFSGIIAGIRIDQRLKNVDLDIYEKNHTVGGTW